MFLDRFKSATIEVKVTSVSDVSPSMRRVTLASDGLKSVQATQVGQFIGVTCPGQARDADARPRRFTIRDFDAKSGTMALEFALHGETGPASKWALNAQRGDMLKLSKPGKGYSVDVRTPNHILVGDPTFLPAALEILALLPASAHAFAFFEVRNQQDEQRLPSRARLTLKWVHSGDKTPGTINLLERALSETQLPSRDCQAWVGAESKVARAVERHLSGSLGLSRFSIHAHGYWRAA